MKHLLEFMHNQAAKIFNKCTRFRGCVKVWYTLLIPHKGIHLFTNSDKTTGENIHIVNKNTQEVLHDVVIAVKEFECC